MVSRLNVVLLASFVSGAALSQSLVAQTSSSPVAYVYVSRPTHLDGFAASSSGRLTPVPGSPFSGISVSHLSVTNKFLFGASDDNQTIYSYSLAANGSVKKVAAINTHNYDPDGNVCFSVGPTQIDYTRATLYNDDWNCDGDSQYVQSYKIETNGQLTFLGNSGGESEDIDMGQPVVLGTNKFLYTAGTFNEGQPGGVIQQYQRQTNGAMDLVNSSLPLPSPKNPDDVYSVFRAIAGDPTNHIAVAFQAENSISSANDGPVVLASFTANSNGELATTNTPDQMAATLLPAVYAMSISPTGKLLAVGAGVTPSNGPYGFQIFHFNGSSPITHYSGLLQNKLTISQFGWDKHNHLYVLGNGYLFVYTVTPTSIAQAPGSPYSIPEASSVIVLDLP
jgi:6-phosphogluconolactonase (cycloisomerase 2 family)